jgi:putative Holliday junction resolvase
VWLGVDVGTVRVGVARSDPDAVLATPLVTLARDPDEGADIAELARLAQELGAVGVVVGLPRTLRGREGASAAFARDYASQLSAAIRPLRVAFIDERLTSVSAQRKLHSVGLRGARAMRAVIDQAAAVELLQQWLDTLRS